MSAPGQPKNVEIIAGTPPGGGQDRTARAVAAVIGGEVTITNVPGRGGGNAWDQLITRRATPNLLAVSSPTLLTNALVGDSSIDDRDLTPLAILHTEYSAVVAPSGSRWQAPASTLSAISDGTLVVSFATALGNMNHLVLAEIASGLGSDPNSLRVRVFDSAREALADVLAGDGDIAIVSAASAVPELTAGTLNGVVVSAPQRLAGIFSEVATCTELSVPCVRGTWRGLVGPPGLDKKRIAGWERALLTATGSESWKETLARNLWVDSYLGPAQTERFLSAEREGLGALLGSTGLVTAVDGG
jgi:putative tricarboxylic transport membrane protein